MTFSEISRDSRLTHRDLREWVTDAIATFNMTAVAHDAVRNTRALGPVPTVPLARGRKRPEYEERLVTSWTADVVEAGRWGDYVVVEDIPVTRILAVVHHPGLDLTEFVVAS